MLGIEKQEKLNIKLRFYLGFTSLAILHTQNQVLEIMDFKLKTYHRICIFHHMA